MANVNVIIDNLFALEHFFNSRQFNQEYSFDSFVEKVKEEIADVAEDKNSVFTHYVYLKNHFNNNEYKFIFNCRRGFDFLDTGDTDLHVYCDGAYI